MEIFFVVSDTPRHPIRYQEMEAEYDAIHHTPRGLNKEEAREQFVALHPDWHLRELTAEQYRRLSTCRYGDDEYRKIAQEQFLKSLA